MTNILNHTFQMKSTRMYYDLLWQISSLYYEGKIRPIEEAAKLAASSNFGFKKCDMSYDIN